MDLWRLSATDLAARIRLREVSAREAARSALGRLDAVNPRLNAVVDCRPEDVFAQADAIDAAIARDEHVGPLAGVPVTVKINTDQAGMATSNGLKAQRDLVAEHDSPVVANLRKAGAVLLGRTNTPTMSLRWFTSNGLFGATTNPRDPSLTPGGSSGGAGAAVASGVGAIAHGTDIAGSIRYPAYACGVHGLRPTLGRIPTHNASGPDRAIGAQLTAVSGPLARTIGDLKRALAAMSAGSARDPWWVPAPLDGPPYRRRVALCARPDGLATAPEVEAALRGAADILAQAGWEVVEVASPPLAEPAALQVRLWLGQGFASLAETVERDGDLGALAIIDAFRETAEGQAPDAVLDALVRRAGFVRAWSTFLEATPLVLMPVSAELPFADGLDLEGPATVHRLFAANMPQVGLPLLGLPALTVATGAVGRVPVGVQLVADRFREDVLLAAGAAIEAALPPIAIAEPA